MKLLEIQKLFKHSFRYVSYGKLAYDSHHTLLILQYFNQNGL